MGRPAGEAITVHLPPSMRAFAPGGIYGYPAGSFGVGGIWIGGGGGHWNNGWHHRHGDHGGDGNWHDGRGRELARCPGRKAYRSAMDGIADATRSQLPDVNILHPHNTQDMHGCPDKHSLCLVL